MIFPMFVVVVMAPSMVFEGSIIVEVLQFDFIKIVVLLGLFKSFKFLNLVVLEGIFKVGLWFSLICIGILAAVSGFIVGWLEIFGHVVCSLTVPRFVSCVGMPLIRFVACWNLV